MKSTRDRSIAKDVVALLMGIVCFGWSIRVAGASTVIMSLWPVDDDAARSWMSDFYETRFRDHLDTAAAVRRASLSHLSARRKAGLSINPFFWAGFVVAGDWR